MVLRTPIRWVCYNITDFNVATGAPFKDPRQNHANLNLHRLTMSGISRDVILGLALQFGMGPMEGDAVDSIATELEYRLRRVISEAATVAGIEYRSRIE